MSINGQKNSDRFKHGHMREGFVVVDSFSLGETLSHKSSLIGFDLSISSFLSLIYLLTPNWSDLFGNPD